MPKSSNDRIGQKVSNYNLVRLIGRGGFADVYLGEHIYLKTLAAIKVLHIRAIDTDQSDILNEARAIAQLERPNIVRLLEYGIEDDYPFLIMSYASQGSLRHYYPKGTQLSVETVIAYAQQVAAALDYAHEQADPSRCQARKYTDRAGQPGAPDRFWSGDDGSGIPFPIVGESGGNGCLYGSRTIAWSPPFR